MVFFGGGGSAHGNATLTKNGWYVVFWEAFRQFVTQKSAPGAAKNERYIVRATVRKDVTEFNNCNRESKRRGRMEWMR